MQKTCLISYREALRNTSLDNSSKWDPLESPGMHVKKGPAYLNPTPNPINQNLDVCSGNTEHKALSLTELIRGRGYQGKPCKRLIIEELTSLAC